MREKSKKEYFSKITCRDFKKEVSKSLGDMRSEELFTGLGSTGGVGMLLRDLQRNGTNCVLCCLCRETDLKDVAQRIVQISESKIFRARSGLKTQKKLSVE